MKATQPHAIAAPLHSRRWTLLPLFALGLASFAWLLGGCVPTGVHPFYRDADVLYDAGLLGVWKDKPDGKERWSFTPGEDKSYGLEIQSDDQRAVFVVHLFKLGDERFLDLYPARSALEEKLDKNPYTVALIPGHLFLRVRAITPTLRMSCMGLDWLRQQLKHDSTALNYVMLPEDRVVFTGSTEAMQGFIAHHLKDTEAWNDMYEDGLVKVGGKPAVEADK